MSNYEIIISNNAFLLKLLNFHYDSTHPKQTDGNEDFQSPATSGRQTFDHFCSGIARLRDDCIQAENEKQKNNKINLTVALHGEWSSKIIIWIVSRVPRTHYIMIVFRAPLLIDLRSRRIHSGNNNYWITIFVHLRDTKSLTRYSYIILLFGSGTAVQR